MELSRRDAIAALAATGIGAGGVALHRAGAFDDLSWDDGNPDTVETMVALAEVVYPTDVSGIDEFVETYVVARVDDEDRRQDVNDALERLDEYAREEYGATFVDLPLDVRDDVLHDLGLRNTQPDPEGTAEERMRYHLINELLYALFTSPTGGDLVGNENPPGHPGGLESYQRGPRE